jgi:hypothetical protein
VGSETEMKKENKLKYNRMRMKGSRKGIGRRKYTTINKGIQIKDKVKYKIYNMEERGRKRWRKRGGGRDGGE